MSARIEEMGDLEIRGPVNDGQDVSGIDWTGNFLLLGSDEGARIEVVKGRLDAGYDTDDSKIPLSRSPDDEEVDIEGIAGEGSLFYVVGSHSLKRKRVKPDKSQKKNRKRLRDVTHEASRDAVFRVELDLDTGALVKGPDRITLRHFLEQDEILARFAKIPSKENGIDIEGIAVRDGRLYVGFRGPVLRGNYVPVLVLESFHVAADYELRFVNLGGFGVRDIVAVDNGFLILAGPIGDAVGHYELWFWTGEDAIGGDDQPPSALEKIGEIPSDGAKAEGVTVTLESADAYELIVVYDSRENGGATRFRASKR